MEERIIAIRKGGEPKFSMSQSGSTEKVQSNCSKLRVYDKISQQGKISPLARIEAIENTIKNLQQPSTEGVQQHTDLIEQYKYNVTELSLIKQNEMLQEDLESAMSLLEKQNQSAEKSRVENVRLAIQVEELSKKIDELQEAHAKVLQEKEDQRMEFESIHVDLQDELSSISVAKMFLEEESSSLQSDMDRRTLDSEEEKVNMKGRLRELEASMDSLNKDLESSRSVAEEKQGQIFDLRNQFLEIADAKTCLEQTNNSVVIALNTCTEENVFLQDRIRELETDLNCLKNDLQSKDVRIQDLTEKVESQLLENGKEKSIDERENGKINGVHAQPKRNGTIDRKTPVKASGESKAQAMSMTEKQTPKQVLNERTTKQLSAKLGKQAPNSWR